MARMLFPWSIAPFRSALFSLRTSIRACAFSWSVSPRADKGGSLQAIANPAPLNVFRALISAMTGALKAALSRGLILDKGRAYATVWLLVGAPFSVSEQ